MMLICVIRIISKEGHMFKEILHLCQNDIVSIVGSGGKTSLMFHLSLQYPARKILITTTTKIMLPNRQLYEYIHIGLDNIEAFLSIPQCGRFVLGKELNKANGKLIGFEPETLSKFTKYFDLCLQCHIC